MTEDKNIEKKMPDSQIREHIQSIYHNLLGREPDSDGMEYFFNFIKQDNSYDNIIKAIYTIIKSPEYINKFTVEMPDSQIREYIQSVYHNLLGRDPDPDGMEYFFNFIKQGNSYDNLIKAIYTITISHEFINKVVVENKKKHKKSLVVLRSDRYTELNNGNTLIFRVENSSDFDWLEQMIIKNSYYETEGVWNLTIDSDKILMAEIFKEFTAVRVLELGCSTGAILKLLYDAGAIVRGIEISTYSIERAFPEIRNYIYHGDFLDESFTEKQFSLVFGLDIFEHFNPNKLDRYINKIYESLENGGYLLCNIPAFGEDEVFGTIFPVYFDDWNEDIQSNRNFRLIDCDENGYPKNGHLIWASTQWWVRQFEKAGFKRDTERERIIHQKYDDKLYFARTSFYLFKK